MLKLYLSAAGLLIASFGASAETSEFTAICSGLDSQQCASLIAPLCWNNANPGGAGTETTTPCAAPAETCSSGCEDRYFENFGLCKEVVVGSDVDSQSKSQLIDACIRGVEPRYQRCRADCVAG